MWDACLSWGQNFSVCGVFSVASQNGYYSSQSQSTLQTSDQEDLLTQTMCLNLSKLNQFQLMLSIFHNSLEFVSKRGPQYWEILYPRLWCSPVLLTCQSCDWHEVFYCRQNFTCLNCVCIKIMNHCTTLPTQKNGLKPGYVNGFYSLLHSCSETRARDRVSWCNPVSIQYAPEKFNTHWTEFYPDAAQWKARQNCTDFWCRYQTQRLGPHWALFVTTHPSVSLFSMTKFLSIIKVFPFLITQSVYFHFLLFVLFFVCLFSTVLRRDLFWCIVTKYWLWTKRRRFRILTL